MSWKTQLFKLNYDLEEEKAALEVISSGWLTMGEKTVQFEKNFSKFLGNEINCIAVSSGTASMHIALMALNLKKNDEVIIPALTFVSDANTVYLSGGKPVLADSASLDNWNVSLDSIKKKITKNTKAIIVVHFAGYPCSEIEEITKFCEKNNIFLLEDVAHAPGATINNQCCGTFGDFGSFSFFSNKNLSVGEGGMVSSKDPKLIEKAKFLRSHGMTSLTFDRHKGRTNSYDVAKIGLNYRIDEIRSAIGIVQLKKLKKGNSKRKLLTKKYIENFSNTEIKIPFTNQPKNSESAFHILPILLPQGSNREEIMNELKSRGIQSSIHYPPFWGFTAYKKLFNQREYPISAQICSRELTLPLYPTMELNKVDEVSSSLINILS
tara:strand:+ start:12990 stop:14129 length:1140 start_codon:yes stop_codon:yes gene_type:complete